MQDNRISKDAMIQEILMAAVANGVHTTGDMFFALAFRTEKELARICCDLHINTVERR